MAASIFIGISADAMTADAADRMDRMYRHQRYIYDATRKFYLLGRDGLIAKLAPEPGDRVLEIGCGTGRNLIALARRYPRVRLYGIDASDAMLATARRQIRRAGLADSISLAQGLGEELDARAMFELDRPLDAIVISYALTMIPSWPLVVARAAQALRPGGRLAIVDFWDQHELPHWFRRVLQGWLSLFEVRPEQEMPEIIGALLRSQGGRVTVESLLGGYAFRLLYIAPA